MKLIIKIVLGAAALLAPVPAGALGDFLDGFDYELDAGFNIGGASPMPLPSEIRKIDGFDPGMNFMIGGKAVKWLGSQQRWGIGVALRFESKGMKTNATVKNYGMEIINDGSRVAGRWTGKVHTNYRSSQFTLPVTAEYRINDRWTVNAGPYIALALDNEFGGYVHDGYMREGDPTGNKVVFEGDSRATYDFSDNLRDFQWGMQLGGAWQAFKHLRVNANFTWGCEGIFESSFKTITFTMYPIYLNLGFGYTF